MKRYPMLDNIQAQPTSHELLMAFHQRYEEQLNKLAAEVIRKATGTIYFTGMGASLFAAFPAADLLRKHGKPVRVVESSELLHHEAAAFRQQDVGILISRSGESVEVVNLAEVMHAAGIKLVGVTNVAKSPLESLVDVSLQVGAQADEIVAVQTYTGTILKLSLLAEEVLIPDSHELAETCLAALPSLTSSIEECLVRVSSWESLSTVGGEAFYFLGRGPALGSAHEAALLLHETAKATAVSMSSGQFRHGPVEAVSRNFRAIVFGTPAETRALDFALMRDLSRMGADVRWIGSNDGSQGSQNLMTWPAMNEQLVPIFEIVPVQIFAYQLALWRNIIPGQFRYAAAVTASESGFPLLEKEAASY